MIGPVKFLFVALTRLDLDRGRRQMGGGGVGGVDGGVGVVVVRGRRQGSVGWQRLVGVQVLVVVETKLAKATDTERCVPQGRGPEHVHRNPEEGEVVGGEGEGSHLNH